jgi:hypothetical protein
VCPVFVGLGHHHQELSERAALLRPIPPTPTRSAVSANSAALYVKDAIDDQLIAIDQRKNLSLE